MSTEDITALMDRGVVVVGLVLFGAVVGWVIWWAEERAEKWAKTHPPKHERRGR